MTGIFRFLLACIIAPAMGLLVLGAVLFLPALPDLQASGTPWDGIWRWFVTNEMLILFSPLYVLMLLLSAPVLYLCQKTLGRGLLSVLGGVLVCVLLVALCAVLLSDRIDTSNMPILLTAVAAYVVVHGGFFYWISAGKQRKNEE